MRIAILPVDGTVRKNDKAHIGLDLNTCGVPADVHALQWEEHESNKGHIEFKSPLVQNQEITSLPDWANSCIAKWDAAEQAEQALIIAAQQANQQA